jgi:release factor glutamine methyltransferase
LLLSAQSNLGALASWGSQQLESASSSPRLDAEVLLAMATNRPRSAVLGFPELAVSAETKDRFQLLIQERTVGVPLAYLIGTKEFYSLELTISRDTLVPRPETELVVDLALALLPAGSSARVLDLGTGSGAIALALKRERPKIDVYAVDTSSTALAVAERNATRLSLEIHCLKSRWFESLPPDAYDLIVTNPPYVSTSDLDSIDNLRHEPRNALDGGSDGLDSIRQIFSRAHSYLKAGGQIILEHGYDQAAAVAALAQQNQLTEVVIHQDLSGRDRVTTARVL